MDTQRILKKLNDSRIGFLQGADAISISQWKTRPTPERWSAAEVTAHLIQVEKGIVHAASRVIAHEPRSISVLKRLHLPLFAVEARLIRRKSPIPLDPQMLLEKETMLGEMRRTRDVTFDFLKRTGDRDLHKYCWPHPFLGCLSFYTWFELIAAHETRHTKQVKEISAQIPNLVESLQK